MGDCATRDISTPAMAGARADFRAARRTEPDRVDGGRDCKFCAGQGSTGLRKVGILTLVSIYVLQMTFLSQDLEHGRKGTGINQAEAEARYGRNLAKLIDPERFPEMAQPVSPQACLRRSPRERRQRSDGRIRISRSGWNAFWTERRWRSHGADEGR